MIYKDDKNIEIINENSIRVINFPARFHNICLSKPYLFLVGERSENFGVWVNPPIPASIDAEYEIFTTKRNFHNGNINWFQWLIENINTELPIIRRKRHCGFSVKFKTKGDAVKFRLVFNSYIL